MPASRPTPLPEPDLNDVNALPCMVLALDLDGSLIQSNRAFEAYAKAVPGLPPGASAAEGWHAMLGPQAVRALQPMLSLRRDFSQVLPVQRAVRWPAADGWLDLQARWNPITGHYLCTAVDVTETRHATQEARERAERFQLLADNVPVLIAYFQVGSQRCLFANRLYAQTFGWDEQAIVGHTVLEIIGSAAAQEIQPYIDQVQNDGSAASYERELRGPDGRPKWLEVNLLPHMSDEGVLVGTFVLISDISRHRLAERAVRESEERLAKFMHASLEGIVFHTDGLVVDVNEAACAVGGYTVDEMVGRQALDFVAPDQLAKVAAILQADQEIAYESAVMHKDGRRIPVEFIARSMVHRGERVRMTIVRDLRDRYAIQERMHRLAHHDGLTGLPNRMSLMEHLGHMIRAARSTDSQLGVLFIDLDHFKRVNDSLGHLAGDALLQTVAQRITERLRATDMVARFGGDEFVVLLPHTLERSDVEEVAIKLMGAISAPVRAEGRQLSVTPSIGISMYPRDGQTADELIKHADSAMYAAKDRGRAAYHFFSAEMARSAYEALVMESQLTQALERGEFVLYFQPQLRASDGQLIGSEALIRWNHPERGLLLPDAFIPLAEQQRQMVPIGMWVLREALRVAKRWHDIACGGVPVAVNLSSLQFHADGFTELVAEVLAQEGMPGHLLELELTERMLMDDLPAVKRRLASLKALGVRVSVDDFGTGYSSLGHLKELPIDKMKIDRSFVKDLPNERDSAAIARAIIQMARTMGLTVIAEGVETDAQRRFLAQHECDELQGMLLGQPMAADQFEAWARAR